MAVKVRQRNGKWWVFIDYHGKRKAKCVGTSKRAAEQVAEKIQARLSLGQFAIGEEKAKRLPFSTYYKDWLDTYVKHHTKEATYACYETAYRVHLLPFLGETPIQEITREQLKRFIYEKLGAGLSRNSVKGYLAPLSEMFNHAIEDGHLERNPCLRIMRTTRKEKGEQQEKIDVLTREEVALLLETCRHHFPASYPFVLCLVRTGMRIGEAVALQWGDIDFHSRFAEVRRNYVDGTLTTPKSGKGRRVDLSVHLTDTLKALLLERKKETLQKGWGEVPPWVFTSEVGTMMDPDNFRKRVWPKLLAKAGLRQVRIHDLRHTFASLLIQNGESLAYVKEQMGHHSIKTTVDTYGHLVPGGNKAAVDRLDDLEHATIRNLSATSSPNTVLGSRVSP
jgi:integrase